MAFTNIKLDESDLRAILMASITINHEKVINVMESERLANPHNASYKPKRHSYQEVVINLKREMADEIIKNSTKRV